MRLTLRRPVALTLAALFGIGLLAGCSHADDDVATLDNTSGPKNGTQKERAQVLVDCLTEVKIPAATYDADGDQLYVTIEPTGPSYRCDGNGCWANPGPNSEDMSESERAELTAHYEKLAAKYLPAGYFEDQTEGAVADPTAEPTVEPTAIPTSEAETPNANPTVLFLGEEDYTERYTTCLKESGYTDPSVTEDPASTLKSFQQQAEATNKWIACARENGFPNLKDLPAPTLGDNEYYPVAQLPATITEQQANALAEQCPTFDAQAHAEELKARQEADPAELENFEPIIDPWVDVASAEGDDQAALDHANKIRAILNAASQEFSDEQTAEAK
jgi:hypothetical protein